MKIKLILVPFIVAVFVLGGWLVLRSLGGESSKADSAKDISVAAVDAAAKEAEKLKNENGIRTYFDTLPAESQNLYEVKSGDNLTKIAKQYGVTTGTIMTANNMKSDLIRPGMKLKIMKDAWSVFISKTENRLYLKANETLVRTYQVATGEDNSTPAGEYKIVNRLVDPTWYYEGKVEPAGSPDNPLGTRWLGFDLDGYGIHGTTDPNSIGGYATLGCVRMHNREVEELFELLPVGAMVRIVE
jgi:lipoprotein-anchoring transpeptidase ErfK/SrfK